MKNRHFERLAALIIGAAAGLTAASSFAQRRAIPVDPAKLMVIDCLLPGQIIKQGGLATTLGPSRPARLTATECEIRGGRYVAYDRANYETALAFWLPQAELGDADAQAYVAEIYEKGLGTAPNYPLAAEWYAKAAAKDHKRAELSLAYFYEQGIGVERDPVKALNLYRKATGIQDDGLTYVSELRATEANAQSTIAALQAQLTQQTQNAETLKRDLALARTDLNERRTQLAAARADSDRLERQLQELQAVASAGRESDVEKLRNELKDKEQQLARRERQVAESEAEVAQQDKQIRDLENESHNFSTQIAELQARNTEPAPVLRSIGPPPTPPSIAPTNRTSRDFALGTYHALIIGNDDYQNMPDLGTALNDAAALEQVLTSRYGFKVRMLPNATRGEILSALNDYTKSLKAADSLLIYYAGHGELDQRNSVGYWLPVNAERGDNTEWISDQMVTNLISLMPARHVLVVADSCYSGVMTRNSGLRLVATSTGDEAEVKRLKKLAQLPSRTVLTSGDNQPVLDGGGGGHSIFAKYLLDILENNDKILEGSTLYDEIFDPVQTAAARFNVEQRPRYAALADAGHLNGEFLFVPTAYN
jgi:hypothetical protein